MGDISGLKAIYETYYQNAEKARKKAPAFAGVFGMGDDPRRAPCHDRFYEDLEQWVSDFAAAGPDPETVHEAVKWILEAPLHRQDTDTYWYLYAAHGHALALIPMLTQEDRKALGGWYDQAFPRRDRLPVQNQVCKMLNPQGAGRRKKLFW